MAPSHSRQLLIWTLPTVAVIISYLWFRRKRPDKSDPGDATTSDDDVVANKVAADRNSPTSSVDVVPGNQASSPRTFCRSLSGVDSAPIDIVIPPKLKASKSNPVVISDEDLDLEIEKIKSMRYGGSVLNSSAESSSSGKERQPTLEYSPTKKEVVEPTCAPTKGFTPFSTPVKTPSPTATITDTNKMANINTDSSTAVTNKQKKKSPGGAGNGVSKKNKSPKTTPTSPPLPGGGAASVAEQHDASLRDSANHSPADVMMASPSLSSISDNHSEGSNDSGKGGSDVATPPPSRTPGAVVGVGGGGDNVVTYEFVIPQTLVGKLIGKQGSFVTQIKDKTGSSVFVRKHPTNSKYKTCVIQATQKEIDSALKMIRDKFPLKRFPEVTLEQVSFTPQVHTIPLIPDHLYLKLIEGINNDTIVSCMVSPNHLFLQQPTHPSFPNLNVLNSYMNVCYAETDSPLLPTPIPENTVCAAFSVDSWHRAMILSTDVESGTCYLKFLDCGGYAFVDNTKLRQIRGDFMLLPFQAAECFLYNVKPVGDAGWTEEAYTMVADLTKGAIIYTQVVDYSDDGIPLVYCYVVIGPQQIVFLNQELVSQGFAEWLSSAGEEAAGVTNQVA